MKLKQILLIDDNTIDNYISKNVLTKSKLAESITAMISAIDALEFLETIKATPEKVPELILLDIRMPIMDGFEFLEVFNNLPEKIKSNCNIFMLTSSQNPRDVERTNQYPFVKGYLNKPLILEKVNDIIQKIS